MSRMPPVPAANQSPYGPGATARDAVGDVPHHADLPFAPQPQNEQEQQRGAGNTARRQSMVAPKGEGDRAGILPAQLRSPDTVMLVVFGALVAAIVWVAGRQGTHAR